MESCGLPTHRLIEFKLRGWFTPFRILTVDRFQSKASVTGGDRAGEIGKGVAGLPRRKRMRYTGLASVTRAISRMSPTRQVKGNNSPATSHSVSSAHRQQRADCVEKLPF